jgi:hypothetical protein
LVFVWVGLAVVEVFLAEAFGGGRDVGEDLGVPEVIRVAGMKL